MLDMIEPWGSDPVGAAGTNYMDQVRSNLASLSRDRGGGAVSTTWHVTTILTCLQLASTLKPSSTLQEALAFSCALFFQQDGAELSQDLLSGRISLPKYDFLRCARVRLDMTAILHERAHSMDYACLRFVSLDTSPQLGRNFLCIREDRIRYLRSESLTSLLCSPTFNLNIALQTRVLPLSTIGAGRASTQRKSLNVISVFLMETSDLSQFEQVRDEVCGLTSDQADMSQADETINVLPQLRGKYAADDPRSFVFPKCLIVIGHLHVLYNALEEACKCLPIAEKWFEQLRALASFLSDGQLRRKFQAMLEGLQCSKLFGTCPRMHIDWRWEFLSACIKHCIVLTFDAMRLHFDADRLAQSDSGSRIGINILNDVRDALSDRTVDVYGYMFRMVAVCIERWAHRLESCHCHAHIWMQARSYADRLKAVMADTGATGAPGCVWKGRQGAWWVAEGIDACFESLQSCTCPTFEAKLSKLPSDVQCEVLETKMRFIAKVIEVLRDKLGFWFKIPWLLFGVFYCHLGGSLGRSKIIAKQCISQYNDAFAAGRVSALHRVARRLIDPDSLVGKELRDFAVSCHALIHYENLFAALLRLVLIPLVERAIEAVHASIKRHGQGAFHMLPSYVCAKVREQQNLILLRSSSEFHSCCMRTWRKRSFLDSLLKQRFSVSKLKAMSYSEKIASVYQSDLMSEHSDIAASRASHNHWLQAVHHSLPALADAPSSEDKQFFFYVKALMVENCYYSLPTDVFSEWSQSEGHVGEQLAEDVTSTLLSMVGEPEANIHELLNVEQTVFRIVNPTPEYRASVAVTLGDSKRSFVVVAPCVQLEGQGGRRKTGRVVVQEHVGRQFKLDLGFILERLQVSFPLLLSWKVDSIRPTFVPKPLSSQQSLVDDDVYVVPAIVGSVSMPSRPWSGSTAVAIRDTGDSHVRSRQVARALAQLPLESVPMSAVQHVSQDTFVDMQTSGLVEVHASEAGEALVTLRADAVVRSTFKILCSPVQTFRVLSTQPLMKSPKLLHILQLKLASWIPVVDLAGALEIGQPLVFECSMSRPKSYFVALRQHSQILDQGVSIYHGRADSYYKCLLNLQGDALREAVADINDVRDEVWKQRLALAGVVEEPDGEEVAEATLAIEDVGGDVGLQAVVPHVVPDAELRRCLVDLGPGTVQYKVWFDHASHQSGHRRAFANCPNNSCIKYVKIGSSSRQHVCAALYMWADHGRLNPGHERADHLGWWPSEPEVQSCASILRLFDF